MTEQRNPVTSRPFAPSAEAQAFFARRFPFETDCWDVHAALALDDPGFVLLDVRNADLFQAGHVPGATHLPHWEITEERLQSYPSDTRFVVYCAGPHCNGAQKAGLRLSCLGRPVKEMIGGMTGWIDEGYRVQEQDEAG